MTRYVKKPNVFDTEEGSEIVRILKEMTQDAAYNTKSSYSPNTDTYADNLMPFVDKHIAYLRKNPSTNPRDYVANLRLITRRK